MLGTHSSRNLWKNVTPLSFTDLWWLTWTEGLAWESKDNFWLEIAKKWDGVSLHKTHEWDAGTVFFFWHFSRCNITYSTDKTHQSKNDLTELYLWIEIVFLVVGHNLHSVSSCNLLNSVLKINKCPLAKSQCPFQSIAGKQSHRPLFSALRRRDSVWKKKINKIK